ncbi:restriction endonuclease [Synechococcus sp. CBW1002]|uniref:restriction endonuclease n=1 Tax=Synechococcus sp. CBW1002 TaxID=1353134 RepID=UPI0018CC7C49|nr:restriction endonuclease [Synechococcus sp. CBW1002]QPN59741.1 restriction endonuclease [Synechococcus sp. CBW1002]
MTLLLIRAGSRGEQEHKFLDEDRVYVTWDGLDVDLEDLPDRKALILALEERFPEEKAKALLNFSSQVWPFVKEMAIGDWVVMPSKLQSGLYFGEFTGDCRIEATGPNSYYHWREINWFSGLIPRTVSPQGMLYSFGAFMTICRIQRNDAEARVKAMPARHWKAEGVKDSAPRTLAGPQGSAGSEEAADAANVNLEELAADRIERLIGARFKGHELALMVEAILQAEEYTTYRGPERADGGADILAGGGELGFGKPQICVEVKSGTDPVDRTTVDKLIGAGQKFDAETCLFVSWGGFRPNVQKEFARDFFRVSLWSRKELLEKLLSNYSELPEEIRLALPLKRVWMVVQEDD